MISTHEVSHQGQGFGNKMYISELFTVVGYLHLHTAGFKKRRRINFAKCTRLFMYRMYTGDFSVVSRFLNLSAILSFSSPNSKKVCQSNRIWVRFRVGVRVRVRIKVSIMSDYRIGINFTAGPPVLTGEFPGGPANFVMRRSGGPIDFCGYS